MCTVSFVSTPEAVIITSNRDEKLIRPAAIPPAFHTYNDKSLVYPKDSKAGGTWFAADSNGTILVLLNGGKVKHNAQFLYRKSRGIIALDIIGSDSPILFWNTINLEDIEPFTVILYQDKKLYELIWDGLLKSTKQLDENKNYIWSSVTLYPEEIRKRRSGWFLDFLKNKKEVAASEMLDFHKNTERDDSENGLIINRENTLITLSITQVTLADKKGCFNYYDLVESKKYSQEFSTL
jgi:uncharacterized protein with NRDE domain